MGKKLKHHIMRIYHFINEKFGLEDLREKHLKIARINELNDPFEFMGTDLSNHEFRNAMDEWKNHYLNKTYGLLCFSKSWENPVQWAHYADRHRGLCLGFDVHDGFLIEVRYQDERLPANNFLADADRLQDKYRTELDDHISHANSLEEAHIRKDEYIDEVVPGRLRKDSESDTEGIKFMEKILCTKFSYWSYEQEYRMFPILSSAKRIADLYYFDFSDELNLKEVIIGVRSDITTNHVKVALGKTAGCVEIFKVREAYREFAMVRDENGAS